VRILFIGLGCPKQEKWMAEHRGKINAVMLGVGAAFDFHAGVKPQAPAWMQKIGLEWLYRLIAEPRRLWWRYLYHNPRFVILAVLDLLGILR
jgi:N-acetylglucosaminyldiphosphoundecaprenol N-acetyl-beta-D-mannosaminyltransferase